MPDVKMFLLYEVFVFSILRHKSPERLEEYKSMLANRNAHRCTPQMKRRSELTNALSLSGLQLREDSRLCQAYISSGDNCGLLQQHRRNC